MDSYEKELEYYNIDNKKDKKLLSIIQKNNEIIIPFCAIISGLISSDLFLTYNFALFMYFISTLNMKYDYSKIINQFLQNKMYYYTFLKNKGEGTDLNIYKMASIDWSSDIYTNFKIKRGSALILSFLFIIAPIVSFSINHIISSVIDILALVIFLILEKRRYNAAKKIYMLGNNLHLRYGQHIKKH